jgi:hypothetical protein
VAIAPSTSARSIQPHALPGSGPVKVLSTSPSVPIVPAKRVTPTGPFTPVTPRSQFPGEGFGRASLGGHIYRGEDIKWLRGRFVQGDFAQNLLDGQILVAKQMPRGKLWKLRRAFVFDPSDPVRSGFMKSIGQDADGELYAITGNFTPSGLEGRIWKIIDASE